MIIVDTDIIIDWLKDDKKIINFLEKHKSEIKISIITALEVLDGARNKYEMKILSGELHKIPTIFLDEQICNLAKEWKNGTVLFY
jgi:predicted nucleic acid-binding protein